MFFVLLALTCVFLQAFGLLFDEHNYAPYGVWNNSVEQKTQMLEFEVTGFEQCVRSSD